MLKKFSFIFLFLLPFLTYPTLAQAGGKADAIAGYLAAERGEDALAVKLYTRAIMSGELSAEDLIESYNNRGRGYDGLGQYDKAIADYNKALELDPTHIFAYNNRGNVFAILGQYDKAIADYNRAIQLNPHYASPYNGRGNAYLFQGEFSRALAEFNRALEIEPGYASPYCGRGNVYLFQGEFSRALAEYNRAMEIEPGEAVDYNNRGLAYSLLGNYEKALADFNKSIGLDPDYALAHRNLGNTYFFLGQFDKAKASYEPVLNMGSSSQEVYYATIWHYLSLKRAGSSEAVRLDAHTNRLDLTEWPGAVLELFLGRTTPEGLLAAAKDRDKTAENQKLCEVYFYLGQYYLIMGEESKGRTMFERCLDTGVKVFIEYQGAKIELNRQKEKHEKPKDPKLDLVHTKQGIAYSKKGQYAKAIEEYNKALEVNPNCALAYYNRSVAYSSMGQYDRAVSDCTRALQLSPRHASSYYSRGVSYWHLGSKNQAIKDLQAAAKLQHKGAQNYLKSMNIEW
jgi:tetratricopeptide (TPR) repeat protein